MTKVAQDSAGIDSASTDSFDALRGWSLRLALLSWILLAFWRLTWQLQDKRLWWDESLSLQRAEQSLLPLLLGHLTMFDGSDSLRTIDQHPFFYFLLQGGMLRVAGESEYALRFVSVMAATLLIPAVWTLARALVRRGALPVATPAFAAVMASVNPFFLWHGQEARPYALWALLAVLSTYCLLRVAFATPRLRDWIAYAVLLAAFLATHYYAVFFLPLHALAWFSRLYRSRPRIALSAAIVPLVGGALLAGTAYYRIIVLQGGGDNFARVNLRILIPDLLNAFSLGLSVDIDQVWWLDLIYGAVILAAVLWLLRRPQRLLNGGWLPLLMILLPVIAILLLNVFAPFYMTARHLSLIGGGYLILLGAGLALVWQWQKWAALPLVALLLGGAVYSSIDYYTEEGYVQNDFTGVASHLAGRLAEGDLVLLKPPFSWRIFEYYLPLATLDAAADQGAHLHRMGVPLLLHDWPAREAALAQVTPNYRRIWLVMLGTHPYLDLEDRTEAWLDENLFQVDSQQFFSLSELWVTLYLPEVPVTWEASVPSHPHAVTFGEQIHLAGFDAETDFYDGVALPVTLHWQTLVETDRRYKYLLRLATVRPRTDPDAVPQIEEVFSLTEREPYDGAIPTIFWAPGQTILEMTELPPGDWPAVRRRAADLRLVLEVYDAETLEKLPVTEVSGAAQTDGERVFLPYAPVQ